MTNKTILYSAFVIMILLVLFPNPQAFAVDPNYWFEDFGVFYHYEEPVFDSCSRFPPFEWINIYLYNQNNSQYNSPSILIWYPISIDKCTQNPPLIEQFWKSTVITLQQNEHSCQYDGFYSSESFTAYPPFCEINFAVGQNVNMTLNTLYEKRDLSNSNIMMQTHMQSTHEFTVPLDPKNP